MPDLPLACKLGDSLWYLAFSNAARVSRSAVIGVSPFMRVGPSQFLRNPDAVRILGAMFLKVLKDSRICGRDRFTRYSVYVDGMYTHNSVELLLNPSHVILASNSIKIHHQLVSWEEQQEPRPVELVELITACFAFSAGAAFRCIRAADAPPNITPHQVYQQSGKSRCGGCSYPGGAKELSSIFEHVIL